MRDFKRAFLSPLYAFTLKEFRCPPTRSIVNPDRAHPSQFTTFLVKLRAAISTGNLGCEAESHYVQQFGSIQTDKVSLAPMVLGKCFIFQTSFICFFAYHFLGIFLIFVQSPPLTLKMFSYIRDKKRSRMGNDCARHKIVDTKTVTIRIISFETRSGLSIVFAEPLLNCRNPKHLRKGRGFGCFVAESKGCLLVHLTFGVACIKPPTSLHHITPLTVEMSNL